jgi:hypothetical protein
MSYPFVQAMYFTAGAMTQPRAVVIHMAEGGGTVSWLTHPTNNNSSHFVVEYSGRIVQMVRDSDASHSLHVDPRSDWPGTGDYGTFGFGYVKQLLGAGASDPNRYIFAVEVEGYAANGPNDAQVAALGRLIADLRSRYPSIKGLLGHRDFQDYKPCPGGRIPWEVLGGHGVFGSTPAPQPPPSGGDITMARYAVVQVPSGTWLYTYSDFRPHSGNVQVEPGRPMFALSKTETYVSLLFDRETREVYAKVGDVQYFPLITQDECPECPPDPAPAPGDIDVEAVKKAERDRIAAKEAARIAEL